MTDHRYTKYTAIDDRISPELDHGYLKFIAILISNLNDNKDKSQIKRNKTLANCYQGFMRLSVSTSTGFSAFSCSPFFQIFRASSFWSVCHSTSP